MSKKREYYGSQTKLALHHFDIGTEKWPRELIYAQTLVKIAAVRTNSALGELTKTKARAIEKAAREILEGTHDDQFPLSLWQSGSGTQFNMNVNEVIAARANEILTGTINHKSPVHPNDDVNMSQSTNDSVPTAIHIAALLLATKELVPALTSLEKTLNKKSFEFKNLTKTGRTHLRDAVSLTLGEEFSGYHEQVVTAKKQLLLVMKDMEELVIGGTAVGTGLNAPKGYRVQVVKELSKLTTLSLRPAKNLFGGMGAHDRMVMYSGSLKVIAVSLMKIANDIRWLSSGPHAGLQEISIPENEPGSSIMPGKVNPTQSEAMMLVASQVIGNDVAVTTAATNLSNFELAVGKPLFAHALIQSTRILADSTRSFEKHCARGIKANKEQLASYAHSSLTEVTRRGKTEGYDTAAKG